MERLKELSAILEEDVRTHMLGPSLETAHKELTELSLAPGAPEEIQNYFNTIKNVCLYARYVYAFYAVADFLTYPLMELALKKRLRPDAPHARTSFRPLLKEAIKQGLIDSNAFSHVRTQRAAWGSRAEDLKELGFTLTPLPVVDTYLEVLADTLPKLRNIHAHPKHMPLVVPGQCFRSIRFAAEFINQLYR